MNVRAQAFLHVDPLTPVFDMVVLPDDAYLQPIIMLMHGGDGHEGRAVTIDDAKMGNRYVYTWTNDPVDMLR